MSTKPKTLTPGVLNREECADSMLICKAFGVFAPKVYRGLLTNGSATITKLSPDAGAQQPLLEAVGRITTRRRSAPRSP